MDRLIRTAWRAFWVGLGASAVLITQTVLMPAPSVAIAPPAPAAEPAPVQHTGPVIARKGLDAHGKSVARIRNAS